MPTDGAWLGDARGIAGVDVNLNQHYLKCDINGVLDVNATITSIFGPIDVIVDNIVPVTQSGAWTVSVSNFPATQPVSGTVTANQGTAGSSSWLVDVTNFPSSYPVTGTVTVLQGTSPWVTSVSNFPATQPVSGTVTTLQGTSPWIVSGTITTSPNVNVHDGSGNAIASTGTSLNVDVTNTVPVTGTFFQTTQPVSEVNIDKSFGTWSYYAGTLGTVNVSAGQRVTAITCHCTTAGSLTIAGGSTITVPANTSFSDNPKGNITAPTIVFTGTDAYFVEVVS
jgi:hypothetical protein